LAVATGLFALIYLGLEQSGMERANESIHDEKYWAEDKTS